MTWEPDYISVAELKAELHITDTNDDVQIARWATSASRMVDGWCHRQFGQVEAPEERFYTGVLDRLSGYYYLPIDDLMTTDGLVIRKNGAEVSSYWLLERNAVAKGKPYERIRIGFSGELSVTALWGWNAVPVVIKQATMMQANRLAQRRESPYGVAGSPSDGSEMRLLASVDPDVKVLLGKRWRREWWAVR